MAERIKKGWSLVLALALLHTAANTAFGGMQLENDAQLSLKIKSEVLKRGLGEEATVKIELKDASEIRGFVAQAGVDDFVLTEQNGGQRTIRYSDVAAVKRLGLSKLGKIAIGIAVGVGVFFTLAYMAFKNSQWVSLGRSFEGFATR